MADARLKICTIRAGETPKAYICLSIKTVQESTAISNRIIRLLKDELIEIIQIRN